MTMEFLLISIPAQSMIFHIRHNGPENGAVQSVYSCSQRRKWISKVLNYLSGNEMSILKMHNTFFFVHTLKWNEFCTSLKFESRIAEYSYYSFSSVGFFLIHLSGDSEHRRESVIRIMIGIYITMRADMNHQLQVVIITHHPLPHQPISTPISHHQNLPCCFRTSSFSRNSIYIMYARLFLYSNMT